MRFFLTIWGKFSCVDWVLSFFPSCRKHCFFHHYPTKAENSFQETVLLCRYCFHRAFFYYYYYFYHGFKLRTSRGNWKSRLPVKAAVNAIPKIIFADADHNNLHTEILRKEIQGDDVREEKYDLKFAWMENEILFGEVIEKYLLYNAHSHTARRASSRGKTFIQLRIVETFAFF